MTHESACRWVKGFDGEAVLVPGCMGGAVYGPEGCNCATPPDRLEAAERGRAAAEAHVHRLLEERDRRLEFQRQEWCEKKRLWKRIRELEAQIAGDANASHPSG